MHENESARLFLWVTGIAPVENSTVYLIIFYLSSHNINFVYFLRIPFHPYTFKNYTSKPMFKTVPHE
jgi:hypothetical protein